MFNQHPRTLVVFILVILIGLERLTYYGIRGVAFVYATDQLYAHDVTNGNLYSFYSLTMLLGGILFLPAGVISDYITKQRLGYLGGIILTIIGYAMLAVPENIFFISGIIIALIGTSFTRVNAYSLLGQLFDPQDSKRTAAFTVAYGAVNIGAILSAVTIGWLGEHLGFRWACGAAAMIMTLALIIFILSFRKLRFETSAHKHELTTSIANSNWNILYILLLAGFSAVFWQLFESIHLISSPLWATDEPITLFDRLIGPDIIQYLNPLVLLPFSILAAWLFYKAKIKKPYFLLGVIGLVFAIFAVLSYVVFNLDIPTRTTLLFWIILMAVMAIIEIFSMPLILSQISILGTPKYSATAMGFYFMILSSIPNFISSFINLTALDYTDFFWVFWLGIIALSVVLLLHRNLRKKNKSSVALDDF